MKETGPEPEQSPKPESGEEGLYSWARLRGAQYRDYSASRHEAREQFRLSVSAGQGAAGSDPGSEPEPGKPEPAAARPEPEATKLETPSSEPPVTASTTEEAAPAPPPAAQAPEPAPEPEPAPASATPFVYREQVPITPPSSQAAGQPGLPPRSEWPQWLSPEGETPAPVAVSGADTLQQARERVASRWFALRAVSMESRDVPEPVGGRMREMQAPLLAVFSLAGGVGKTSLVATLGRALAAHGERVLLVDTTSYGLLPFYFGSRELRPGVMRNFAPPPGSTDAPINVVSLEAERYPVEATGNDALLTELERSSRGANRLLVDVATGAHAMASRLLRVAATVLVPLLPDMNSVVSLGAIEDIFRTQRDNQRESAGRGLNFHFVLNQFDDALPLHLDIREVLRERLGERLLPFVLRRSPAMSEALAEGMTVMDYAPGSSVAEDFVSLASWLRGLMAPAAMGARGVRWSER